MIKLVLVLILAVQILTVLVGKEESDSPTSYDSELNAKQLREKLVKSCSKKNEIYAFCTCFRENLDLVTDDDLTKYRDRKRVLEAEAMKAKVSGDIVKLDVITTDISEGLIDNKISKKCMPPLLLEGEEYEKNFNKGIYHYAKKDYKKAIEYWLPYAEAGSGPAMANLAALYNREIDGQIDLLNLYHWSFKSGLNGDSQAQFNLAVMFLNGETGSKDLIKSYVWAEKAAQGGHDTAQKLKGDLDRYLSNDQIVEAQKYSAEIFQ
ncbi:tetratricopeptide repeat protein [Simiduia curdlanivorans]|uniref:Tetratricopeptide repeat protein n=2 Tax=Simiduia curdlanivorans TaxID=1492769 RepID=A0ABV8V2J7_9GAMM